MAIVGLTLALREFATTNFLVQKNNLTTTDVRTAFTVLLLLTTAIAVSLWATARALGQLLRQWQPRDVPSRRRIEPVCRDLPFYRYRHFCADKMAFSKLAVLNIVAATVN